MKRMTEPTKRKRTVKLSPLEALEKAVAAARKAGVRVKGYASHTTEEGTTVVRL